MARTKQQPRLVGGKTPRKEPVVGSMMVASSSCGGRERRYKPGVQALREIRRYQQSTELLIRKLPFMRLVKELACGVRGGNEWRFQSSAVAALQEATEGYLVGLLGDTKLCADHAGRATIRE